MVWWWILAAVFASCSSPPPVVVETIEVFGPYRGPAAEGFHSSLESFGEGRNVEIRYTGSSDFTRDLQRGPWPAHDRLRVRAAHLVAHVGFVRSWARSVQIGGVNLRGRRSCCLIRFAWSSTRRHSTERDRREPRSRLGPVTA